MKIKAKTIVKILLPADLIWRKIAIYFGKNIFCWMFNVRAFIRRKDVRFSYDEVSQMYCAKSQKSTRYFMEEYQNYNTYGKGVEARGDSIAKSYFIDKIDFQDGDLVVDCGANVGDLKLHFEEKKINIEYIGIEPSPKEYRCLKKNVTPSEVFNLGLWNSDGELQFFVSSENADSSLICPAVYSNVITVRTCRLDTLIDKKIKLLKLEAEGAEPEVISGCSGLLENIEYIAADLGFERGVEQKSTFAEVCNFLIASNFEIIEFSVPGMMVLFRNKNQKFLIK